MTVTVAASCTACGVCLVTCPTHALVPAPRRPRVVDASCTDCWLCIEVCPVDAIGAGDDTVHSSKALRRGVEGERGGDGGAAGPSAATPARSRALRPGVLLAVEPGERRRGCG